MEPHKWDHFCCEWPIRLISFPVSSAKVERAFSQPHIQIIFVGNSLFDSLTAVSSAKVERAFSQLIVLNRETQVHVK